MTFNGIGYCNLNTDQRMLFLALENLLHLQKKVELLRNYIILDINILWIYKYLSRELEVARKYSNKLCSSCVLQTGLLKSSCIVECFLDLYLPNVWSFTWQSLNGENSRNIINGFQHFIIYMAGLFQHGKAVSGHTMLCLMWHWKRLAGSHITALVCVSTPVLSFMVYWKKPLGRQILSLQQWLIRTGWNMKGKKS